MDRTGKSSEAASTSGQALIAYTLTAADAERTEKDKGGLEPGKSADLAVLWQDIFRAPNEDMPKTVSVLTMVDGRIVDDAMVDRPEQDLPGRDQRDRAPRRLELRKLSGASGSSARLARSRLESRPVDGFHRPRGRQSEIPRLPRQVQPAIGGPRELR